MNRRAGAVTLIGLLLGGYPARPAVAAPAPRAKVTVRADAPAGAVEDLCAGMRRRGLVVRVAQAGRSSQVEIVAAGTEALAEALRAFRRAAEKAGMKFEFHPPETAPEAISAGCAEARPAGQTRTPPAPPAAPVEGVEVAPPCQTVSAPLAVAPEPNRWHPGAGAIRAPPA